MDNMNELTVKPCSCCGSPAVIATYKEEGKPVSGWGVRCSDYSCCFGLVFDFEETREKAIKEWNSLSDKNVTITVKLDEDAERLLTEKCEELNTTPEQYLTNLLIKSYTGMMGVRLYKRKNN